MSKDNFNSTVQQMVSSEAIIARAQGLNFWGKKIDASREKVIAILATEFSVDSNEIAEMLLLAERPQKAAKVAKEKEIDLRPVVSGTLQHIEDKRPLLSGNRFIVSCAQNNTPIHGEFVANLECYAEAINAQIVIFPFIYNKNGFQNGEGSEEEIYYDPAILKYLQKESVFLGSKKVSAMAFNILPTVKYPLGGMKEAIGCSEALIVPHATISHECVAVLGAQTGRVVPAMYSTGTITQKNYIQQQAGHKAECRHNFGALLLEYNKLGQFWIRQIETDESGNFQDLRNIVVGQEISDGDISVVSLGDIHAEKLDENVANLTWRGDGNILRTLQPEFVMLHDLCDFSSMNHHNRENHLHTATNCANDNTVLNDLMLVSSVLVDISNNDAHIIVVNSNHDNALMQWLQDGKYEPRRDPKNALTYYKMQTELYSRIENGGAASNCNMLEFAIFELIGYADGDKISFLNTSESFLVDNVELAEHGHSGINGSKGSPKQFSSGKYITGHTHSPSIYGGCYTGGVTGKLLMGYNAKGASSWQHAHVVQYKNGFRTILHLKPESPQNKNVLAYCVK